MNKNKFIACFFLRPLNEKEVKSNTYSVLECIERRKEIIVNDKNSPNVSKTFTFDKVTF